MCACHDGVKLLTVETRIGSKGDGAIRSSIVAEPFVAADPVAAATVADTVD